MCRASSRVAQALDGVTVHLIPANTSADSIRSTSPLPRATKAGVSNSPPSRLDVA
jgi:hypothetical protein